ncbi:MAG: tetratricopeptide repeat protein [Lachnospiraceae bacterium]|nr:tetratricopeptide repeat protein [Lachnospiraceae bacterium]
MKCPNCGSEMAEGNLYCEKCGKDIHIVPDFEPELEQNIEQTIHTILKGLDEDQKKRPESESAEEVQLHRHRTQKKKSFVIIILLLGVLAVLIAGGAAAWVYGYYSKEVQVSRAVRYTEAGKYDKAISCYNRALELDCDNIELIFSLAEVYYLKNNKIEYEYLMREIIKNPNATVEQLEGAYDKLIAIYRAREDYQTINTLLLGSGNENLISTYQNYIASAPEFSVKEGYYTSIQPLKLTAAGTGKIYFTMDGSVPTEQSSQYTAPIILENGDYVVTAYFVNEKGVASDVVTKEYHIENDEISPPEISALSGEYYFPINIEIMGDDENVYYTTDGTMPNYFSNVYTGPIPMPLGKSNFKFARIEEGVTGTVADRVYNLTMNTDFTPEQAVASVMEYALRIGKIYDETGHFDDTDSSYAYEYQYVTNINNIDDFYVIAEIFRGADGSLTRTGNNYAVNAYTGEMFRLQSDKRGKWLLIIIEEPEPEEEDDWEEEDDDDEE